MLWHGAVTLLGELIGRQERSRRGRCRWELSGVVVSPDISEGVLRSWGCFGGCRQSLALCKYREIKGKHFPGLRYRFVSKTEDLIEIGENVPNFFSRDKNLCLEMRRAALVWAGRALGCALLGQRDGAVQAESAMRSREREEDGFVRLEVFKFGAVCLYVTILGFFP